ncbi:lipopolysaccharide biosynthesis protein [Pseudarthrobacter sp. MEB009]|uniref:lipopolysaccharide biosynthesis protein n=1 Tax=Pseudarthrobacter sp. MEB009 TaxID=3040326 RepID=UPI002557A80E|nr:lipopolysaccharide biosynthesis protein [Pseudarthrobacter sp. MEB009]
MTTDEITSDGQKLGRQAVRGASATIVGQLVRLAVLLASTVVLARILSPEDFGLVAIVMSVVALGELFRDFGLSMASARSLTLSHRQMSNLFWINTMFGIFLAGAGYLLANPVATLFSQPKLHEIVIALSLTFIFSGFSTQFRAHINQKLMFKKLAFVDTTPVVAGLIGALAYAAIFGADYWVLVIQQIITSLVAAIMACTMSGWWPGWPSRRASIREVVSFGLGVFGSQAVAYVTKNVDNLSLGYVWGPSVLGVYGRAYQLLMLPLSQLAAPLTRVAVPILTRIVDDRERFQRFLLQGQLVGGVGLGIIYGVACGFAYPLVDIVFGSAWIGMAPILQALAVGGVFRGLNQITFWIFLAKSKTGAQFRFYLLSQPLIIIIMLAGLPWGALGVAIGHSLGYFINWIISIWWCGKATKTEVAPLAKNGVASILLCVVPVITIGLAASTLLQSSWLAIGVGTLAIAVYGFVAYFLTSFIKDVVRSVRVVLRRIR